MRYISIVSGVLFHADTLEVSSQLRNPWKEKDMQAIERIQRSFTYKINEVQHLNYRYLKRLHKLKLHSLHRRRERYKIIIWKITQHILANLNNTIGHKIKTRHHPR